MTYVYMKVLESSPKRYDRGMAILTLGRLAKAHCDIANRIEPEWRVLDIGCGTGSLAALIARRGAQVVGIDISSPMLVLARQKLRQAGGENLVTLREMGVAELDTVFGDAAFDAVVSSLTFSELSDDEVAYTLHHCRRILSPGGLLMVADEILPHSVGGRALTWLFRLPFAVLTFVLTQNTTQPVAALESRIAEAGFRVIEVDRYLLGTLRTVVAGTTGR
jgi:demethylmenaquinone methyltransferase/2-methoxy-6-polyprenyl-1,4-benzoquinol methylase